MSEPPIRSLGFYHRQPRGGKQVQGRLRYIYARADSARFVRFPVYGEGKGPLCVVVRSRTNQLIVQYAGAAVERGIGEKWCELLGRWDGYEGIRLDDADGEKMMVGNH